jgi:ELWxxDGT repeat protein
VLLFAAADGITGHEVWASNGRRTALDDDVATGPGSSSPRQFTIVGSHIFFTADDNRTGTELWAIPRAAVVRALGMRDGADVADLVAPPSDRRTGRHAVPPGWPLFPTPGGFRGRRGDRLMPSP